MSLVFGFRIGIVVEYSEIWEQFLELHENWSKFKALH